MKIMCFGDIHFHHTHRFSTMTAMGYTTRELEHLSCADRLIDIYNKYNIDKVVCLGDIYGPVCDNISCQTQAAVLEFFTRLTKHFDVDVLVGNHDLSQQNINQSIHKLVPLKHMPRMHVYDKPEIIDNFIYMPYIIEYDQAAEYLKQVQDKANKIIFSHLELKDIDLGNGVFSKKGVSLELLRQFKMTLQGHYHSGGYYGKNIQVAGSTQRLSFKDLGRSRRNILIYDTDTNTTIRESFNCPDWLTFTDENIDNILNVDNNNYIKLDLSMDMLLTEEIKDKLKLFKGTDVHIDVNRIRVNKQLNSIEESESEEEVIRQFVNKSDNSEEQKEALINEGINLLNKVKA